MPPILPPPTPEEALLWGHQPLRLRHRLHENALFSRTALGALIETYPRTHYSLIAMGGPDDPKSWCEGNIGDIRGVEVIEAIATGRMWLNLRNVSGVDNRYGTLLSGIFDELKAHFPGFAASTWQSGILISSPAAQVYYHADLPGQLLWQIAGKKRVHLYPNSAPFITRRDLEDIALFDLEIDLPYRPWYDTHAKSFDLTPGQMLSWPLNAPHRVENLEGVNISMTVSFSSPTIRRQEILHLANGLLRHRFGLTPRSERIEGLGFWAKAMLQKAMRDTGWVRKARAMRRPVTFTLDRARLEQIRMGVAAE